MWTQICKCDGPGCGKTKGETNHWWMLHFDAKEFFVKMNSFSGPSYLIFPWKDYEVLREDLFHFCGVECLLKKLSALLGAYREPENFATFQVKKLDKEIVENDPEKILPSRY